MKEEVDFYQISLKLILRNKNGEILLLKAQNDSISAGFFDLPGGRINNNEFNINFSEIIKREVEEELGNIDFKLNEIPVSVSRNENIKTGNRILHIFFEATYLNGDIKISNEHLGYRWINLKEINPDDYFTLGILDGIKNYIKNKLYLKNIQCD